MKNILLALLLIIGPCYNSCGQAYRDSALARVRRQNLPDNIGYVDAINGSTEVYTMPKFGSALVGAAGNGSQVTVLNSDTPDWYFLAINGIKGWMPTSVITANLYFLANRYKVAWKNIADYPNNASLEIKVGKAPVALTPSALSHLKQHPAFRDAARKR